MSALAAVLAALPTLDDASQSYAAFHARRYAFLLKVIERVLRSQDHSTASLRILDIGMSFQTAMLWRTYPSATIDTLGYFDHRFTKLARGRHVNYDLNFAGDIAGRPGLEPYDLIVLAEVIEHLYVAPAHVLRCIHGWLRPGGTLVIQTPNAVSLRKRWGMLFGRTPFEMIREDPTNPGHFCEYTLSDLKALASDTEFAVTGTWLRNYFGSSTGANTLYDMATKVLPGNLADGITITARRSHFFA